MSDTVVMGRQGRIVIPAQVRAEMELEPGVELAVRVEGRRVVLERADDAVQLFRGIASEVPSGRSLVDELIAGHRRAARVGE